MGLIREPKDIDFSTQSKHWTAEELRDFRKLLVSLKAKKTPNTNDVKTIKVEKNG